MSEEKPGPTGEYPDGKLNDHDDGELNIAVRVEGDYVVLQFSSPVKWFALPSGEVPGFCDVLMQHAQAIMLQAVNQKGVN